MQEQLVVIVALGGLAVTVAVVWSVYVLPRRRECARCPSASPSHFSRLFALTSCGGGRQCRYPFLRCCPGPGRGSRGRCRRKEQFHFQSRRKFSGGRCENCQAALLDSRPRRLCEARLSTPKALNTPPRIDGPKAINLVAQLLHSLSSLQLTSLAFAFIFPVIKATGDSTLLLTYVMPQCHSIIAHD